MRAQDSNREDTVVRLAGSELRADKNGRLRPISAAEARDMVWTLTAMTSRVEVGTATMADGGEFEHLAGFDHVVVADPMAMGCTYHDRQRRWSRRGIQRSDSRRTLRGQSRHHSRPAAHRLPVRRGSLGRRARQQRRRPGAGELRSARPQRARRSGRDGSSLELRRCCRPAGRRIRTITSHWLTSAPAPTWRPPPD